MVTNSAEQDQLTRQEKEADEALTFCRGRVNCDGLIQVGFGRPHLDRDTEPLQNLIASQPDDMDAHHALLRADHDKLVYGGLFELVGKHGEVKRFEGGFVWGTNHDSSS